MAEKPTTFDPVEGFASDETIAGFMEEAFKTQDVGYIAHALGVVARAEGMTQIANETGNPTLKTTIAVMKALGVALTATPVSDPKIPSAA
jgi:probable addiction module antidote protein